MQPTATFASARSGTGTIGPGKPVPYISFDAVVGRNSQFKDLSSDQLEELGGVEYRALKVLTWVVPSYLIIIQLVGWIIFWPYIGTNSRYDPVFQNQPRFVPVGWFSAFQSVSAFSNTGMSLVDQSMIPFQKAYLMILYLVFLILAGNTAYPIFLRFTIWVISKLAPVTSRLHETTRFLLDHPRRCYIYLFPAHQTVFLLLVIVIMMATDWVSFLVLDIGTEAIEKIPAGDRVIAGFLQSAAVRAAGFAIVPLAALAPAVKVLYTIMMYVSVYPIAMSVRATNVYEERSLGLFDEAEDDDSDEESAFGKADPSENKMVGWTRYLAFHARRQLAFDIWWLGLALWLVCIIERAEINNPENESFFNIFAIIFELVSAYGTVGLSLGVNNDNFSLSGAFRPLAKLVVCCVMIRGRHRGLPVAIDRAVMLPTELLQEDKSIILEDQFRRSRRESMHSLSINGQDHFPTRRDSSLSLRPRPSVPFFPPPNKDKDKDESAIADDDEEEDEEEIGMTTAKHFPVTQSHAQRGSGSSHPPPSAPSHDFASWSGLSGIGGANGGGGGAGGGSLTPVREVTMSRAPSPELQREGGEAETRS